MGFYQFTFWPLESVNVCVGKVGEPKGFLDLIMFAVLLSQKSKKKEKLIGPSWCPKNYI